MALLFLLAKAARGGITYSQSLEFRPGRAMSVAMITFHAPPKSRAFSVLCLLAVVLPGCAQPPLAITGSIASPGAPQPAPNTPANRLEHLAWNSAWAQGCGFYFDNLKLKSAYLAFEASAGTPPDQVSRLAGSYDKAQGVIRSIASNRLDQCTELRLARIRANIARYLAGDFTPGEAV